MIYNSSVYFPAPSNEITDCLWSDYDDTTRIMEIEKDLEKIMEDTDTVTDVTIDSNQTECCICFELINKNKNNCITECGHMFCLKCLATTMYHDTWNCPYCRTSLIDVDPVAEVSDDEDEEYEFEVVDEDDDEPSVLEEGEVREERQNRRRRGPDDDVTETDDDDDDNTTISEDVDPYSKPCTVEEIARRLVENGYTMEDLISLYFCRSKENPENTSPDVLDMMDELDTKISNIVNEADKENYERSMLNNEDVSA